MTAGKVLTILALTLIIASGLSQEGFLLRGSLVCWFAWADIITVDQATDFAMNYYLF
jgi:hypothetical protein